MIPSPSMKRIWRMFDLAAKNNMVLLFCNLIRLNLSRIALTYGNPMSALLDIAVRNNSKELVRVLLPLQQKEGVEELISSVFWSGYPHEAKQVLIRYCVDKFGWCIDNFK